MKWALVIGAAVLLALPSAASAGNRVTYRDATGDASTGNLDVSTVGLQVDNTGTRFSFTLAVPDLPPLPSDAFVYFALDTDDNQTNGNGGGTDLVVKYDASKGVFTYTKFDGGKPSFVKSESDPALVTYTASTVTLVLDLTDLLHARILHFVVAAGRGATDENLKGYDLVPDFGFGTFWINPRVRFATAHFFPGFPRAGRLFEVPDVAIFLRTGEEVAPDSFTCRATLAGKKLAGKGDGGCRWRMPKNARSKRLVIRVNYRFQGVSGKTAAYDFRVG